MLINRSIITALLLLCSIYVPAKEAPKAADFRVQIDPAKKDLLVDELVDLKDAVKKVSSLTGLYEKEILEKYVDIDLKGILLANSISRNTDAGTLRPILDAMLLSGAYKKQLDNPSIVAVMKQFYADCERCFKVRIYSFDYGKSDQLGLGGAIAADIMTGYRLDIVKAPVCLSSKEIKKELFMMKLSLPDAVLASVLSHKTGESLRKIADKRLKGVDWETIAGGLIPDHALYMKDEGRYYNMTSMKIARPFYCPNKGRYGNLIQNFDVLDLFEEAKRVSSNAFAFMEGKPLVFKPGSLAELFVTRYSLKEKDICRFLELSGNPDRVLRCVIINKRTKKSIEYLIKDSQRFDSFDEFYEKYLMLDKDTAYQIEREYSDILWPPDKEEPEEEE